MAVMLRPKGCNPLKKRIRKMRYRGAQWYFVRLKVLDRDKHRCRKCGDDHSVQVHHIVAWRDAHDNSLKNLITLCVECHRKEDLKYAKHGVTEWMKEQIKINMSHGNSYKF